MGSDNKMEIDRVDKSYPVTRLLSLDQLKSSFPLRFAFGGLLLILAGYILNTGVWAAIFAIWGTAILLIGLLSHFYIYLSYQGSTL